MLTFILGLLGSSGFGSVVGLVGGLLNRAVDLKAKAMDQTHELALKEQDLKYMDREWEHRGKVAAIEAEGRVEAAGYEAMAKSYSFAAPTSKDGWVDLATKLVRPILTLSFFVFTIYVFYQINSKVSGLSSLNEKEVLEMWKFCIQWIFFQAGVSIGWWFAMRPGRFSTLKV